MTNIGLLYSHPRMLKQLRRYIKKNTSLDWKKIYSVSITVPECKIILSGPDFMEKLGEFAFAEVYPVGWEKGYRWYE